MDVNALLIKLYASQFNNFVWHGIDNDMDVLRKINLVLRNSLNRTNGKRTIHAGV